LFFWQIPHFIAISIFRRDEYARAGLKVAAVVHGLDGARIRIVGWSLLQFAASLAVLKSGVGGRFYEGAAFALGAVLLTLARLGLRQRTTEETTRRGRWVFLYSPVFLPVAAGARV